MVLFAADVVGKGFFAPRRGCRLPTLPCVLQARMGLRRSKHVAGSARAVAAGGMRSVPSIPPGESPILVGSPVSSDWRGKKYRIDTAVSLGLSYLH